MSSKNNKSKQKDNSSSEVMDMRTSSSTSKNVSNLQSNKTSPTDMK